MKTKRGRVLMILSAVLLSGVVLAVGLALSRITARAAYPNCIVDDDGGAGVDYTAIDAAVDDPSCLTVTVAAGVYTETVTIASRDLALIGAGVGNTVVDAGGSGRALYLSNSTVEMSGFTLFNGSVGSNSGGAIRIDGGALSLENSEAISSAAKNGGGIYNFGALTLTNVTIMDNSATERGGGLYNASGHKTTLVDTMIVSNTADLEGGGIYNNNGITTIDGSTIAHNTLLPSSVYAGGGIYNSGPMTITNNSTIAHNTSPGGDGGGIRHGSGSTLVIADSEIISNASQWRGGGIFTWGDAVLTNVSVQGNESTDGDGGGIALDASARLTVMDCTIISNTAASSNGGGISTYSANVGTRIAVISNTVVIHNHAGSRGGGIYNVSVVTLTASAVISNSANRGGGIENIGSGSLALTNVTLSGNEAQSGDGGALFHYNGTTNLVNVTIVNNHAIGGDGGGVSRLQDTVNLKNTLIAGNSDDGGEAPDCDGTITSQGHNLIEDPTGCTIGGDLTGVISNTGATIIDPLTETMGTLVHPLPDDSPAVAAGTDAGCPDTDQRGVGRVPPCDIGAYEVARWVYLPLVLRNY